MAWRCLCRANCFDRHHGVADAQEFLADHGEREGPVGAANTGYCNWPRCFRGDPHPALEDRLEPVEWR